jgi:hypothetical protein
MTERWEPESPEAVALADWHEEFRGIGVDGALELLAEVPPIDELVVCHGDSCAPNTLIGDDGRSGHVDLGELGVADRRLPGRRDVEHDLELRPRPGDPAAGRLWHRTRR